MESSRSPVALVLSPEMAQQSTHSEATRFRTPTAVRPAFISADNTDFLKTEVLRLQEENEILKARLGKFIRSEVTPEEEQKIHELFNQTDVDHDGYIDLQELLALYTKLGEHLSSREVEQLMTDFKPASPGRFTYSEFISYWKKDQTNPSRYSQRFKLGRTPLGSMGSLVRSEKFNTATRESGERGTLEYRVHFYSEGVHISPWHDIPLYASSQKIHGPVNFVVEIPKWTRAKFEISTGEEGNPIKQDSKNGVLRFYKWGDIMFNYGAFPQTWEDPHHITPDTGHKGDNDPLDCVEIGVRQFHCGQVVAVKPLGVLALIDDGETDWKVIAIAADDILAPKLNNIADVEEHIPGAIEAVREFFRIYKVAEGKPINEFGFNGEAKDAAYARDVIEETHKFWKTLHESHRKTVSKDGE